MSEEVFASLFYTSHHNWQWVVDEAVHSLVQDGCAGLVESHRHAAIAISPVNRIRDLPSSIASGATSKPTYSLFRVELATNNTIDGTFACVKSTWATNRMLEFLDPKDALYHCLLNHGAAMCMPDTLLIPHDVNSLDDITRLLSQTPSDDTFTQPKLLKAALGSGGFGLYFVTNMADVLSVITAHRVRATSLFPGFLEGLEEKYKGVPQWSLQTLLSPVRIAAKEARCPLKSQVRAYVAACNEAIYLYKVFEVRLPHWEECEGSVEAGKSQIPIVSSSTNDSSTGKWSYDVENELVGDGQAQPYNEKRQKADTQRFLLCELDELKDAHDSIEAVMKVAMTSLQSAIKSDSAGRGTSQQQLAVGRSEMAVAGVDLIVERCEGLNSDPLARNGFRAFVIELNNNPAMAGAGKRLSGMYRNHLVSFAKRLLVLGLSNGKDCSEGTFEQLW